jgi:hypothetical protein
MFYFAICSSKNIKITLHRIILLPFVLYGCETWSLTLREKHRLRVSENMVLRKMFVSKKEEATGEWRRLQDEELHDLYSHSVIHVFKSRGM